jgi:transposase
MMELPAGMRIWIMPRVTFSGQVFIFRGKRGDLIKVLWFDGDGLCLFAKRLERGRFIWPQATSETVSLTPAQLSMLLEGIDSRRPVCTQTPQIAV